MNIMMMMWKTVDVSDFLIVYYIFNILLNNSRLCTCAYTYITLIKIITDIITIFREVFKFISTNFVICKQIINKF